MYYKTTYLIFLLLALGTIQTHAQHPALSTYDEFYLESLDQNSNLSNYFLKDAVVSTIVYDSAGNANNVVFTPVEYQKELTRADQAFRVTRTPMVLLFRTYNDMVSIYGSIHLELVDRSTGEVYKTESIQSMKLVKKYDDWYISSLSIQNEIPSDPIPSHLRPKDLVEQLASSTSQQRQDADREIYNPDKVYRIHEVDEPPSYPGNGELYLEILEQFSVSEVEQPGYTPFFITIGEDGGAELTYAHDLSGYQITRAESFARSMLIWYPAIKDAASVKCRLLYYIHE